MPPTPIDRSTIDHRRSWPPWPGASSARDRHVTDVVGAANLDQRLAAGIALARFAPLVRRELERTTEAHASGYGSGAAFARPGAYQLALKLSETSEHGQDQAAVRIRCVGPGIGNGPEGALRLADIAAS